MPVAPSLSIRLRTDTVAGVTESPRTFDLLGTPLLATTYEGLVVYAHDLARRGGTRAIDLTNTHIVTLRRHDAHFRAITSRFDHFVPDGMPLIWCLNARGAGLRDRVYGPTFMRRCLEASPAPWTHYLLGGSAECVAALRQKFANAQIVGARHGYFSPDEEAEIVAEINRLAPDFIWVGLGTPKQQDWIHRQKAAIGRGVLFAVGFAFDVNSRPETRRAGLDATRRPDLGFPRLVRAAPPAQSLPALQHAFPLLSGERCDHFSSCLTNQASSSSSSFSSSSRPAPARRRTAPKPSFIKGVTVSCQTSGWEWATPEMAQTLDELKSLGVNSVAIHPYAQIQNDGHVRFRHDEIFATSPCRSIGRASAGCRSCSFRTSPIGGRSSSGGAKSISPTKEEWDRFFGDYQTWIVQMARWPKHTAPATFCIGLEFTYAQKFDARWRQIIAAIRQVYHGKLTYGGNWDSFQEVTFWDALDYIGVLAYFPLTKSPKTRARRRSPPPGKRSARSWPLIRKRMATRNFSSSRSATTRAHAPRPSPGLSKWAVTNADEMQQRCIDVALDLPRRCPTIAGMYWWKWFPELPSREEENYRLQTPQSKR